jgi:hypothetical protein
MALSRFPAYQTRERDRPMNEHTFALNDRGNSRKGSFCHQFALRVSPESVATNEQSQALRQDVSSVFRRSWRTANPVLPLGWSNARSDWLSSIRNDDNWVIRTIESDQPIRFRTRSRRPCVPHRSMNIANSASDDGKRDRMISHAHIPAPCLPRVCCRPARTLHTLTQ